MYVENDDDDKEQGQRSEFQKKVKSAHQILSIITFLTLPSPGVKCWTIACLALTA